MKRLTNDEFKERASIIHNNFYNYDLIDYKNNHTKIKIICPIHGEFEQEPNSHLRNSGCPKCYHETHKDNLEIFKEKANIKHNNFYDYSLTEYTNSQTKVKIICHIHGVFKQKPNSHLNGSGCPKCANNIKLTADNFILKSNKIHKKYYNYSLVKYDNMMSKVKIICPKHGIFEQIPNDHLRGHGCTYCRESKNENKISLILDNLNILYEREKRFKNCKNHRPLPFDFYLSEHNICIEYDGEHHYHSNKYFGGDKRLKYTQKNDQIKNEYCLNNNIRLIRIKYDENIEEILNNLL